MLKYEATLHTPDALASQIEVLYQRDPDLLVMGSLGRASLFNAALAMPNIEYDARGETPLTSGKEPRDIDIITTAVDMVSHPFEVDTRAFRGTELAIIREGDDWILQSEQRGFSESLHPAVMEPVVAETVFGIPVQTVLAQTHLALTNCRPYLRPRDGISQRLLHQAQGSQLPQELYAPFDRLMRTRPDWRMRVNGLYNKYTPDAAKRVASSARANAQRLGLKV
ncbi:MAG TPA: hypothetical protein VLF60_04965 [Candidatus Saccharimonadales bacterium]|nr:hypothetical protein [Candidatus Saccharimonadales bacterium]